VGTVRKRSKDFTGRNRKLDGGGIGYHVWGDGVRKVTGKGQETSETTQVNPYSYLGKRPQAKIGGEGLVYWGKPGSSAF